MVQDEFLSYAIKDLGVKILIAVVVNVLFNYAATITGIQCGIIIRVIVLLALFLSVDSYNRKKRYQK